MAAAGTQGYLTRDTENSLHRDTERQQGGPEQSQLLAPSLETAPGNLLQLRAPQAGGLRRDHAAPSHPQNSCVMFP